MSRIDRAPHDRDYTLIANAALRDPTLSWAAKGLLAHLLSFPDDWTVVQGVLERAGPDGRAATRRARAELERRGYLDFMVQNTGAGRVTLSTVREEPKAGTPRRETGLYEVPTNESSHRRKSALGSVVQSPLLAVVHDEPAAEPPWVAAGVSREDYLLQQRREALR